MDDAGTTRNSLPREIQPGVLVGPDEVAGAQTAARQFVEWAWQFIAREGRFSVALAGGNTPREMYRVLATPEFRTQVDWSKVHLFWGDERSVGPDHVESNYGMARRELLVRGPAKRGGPSHNCSPRDQAPPPPPRPRTNAPCSRPPRCE